MQMAKEQNLTLITLHISLIYIFQKNSPLELVELIKKRRGNK